MKKENSKAVILLSGGLDSTTVLATAKANGFDCYTLSFEYGQRSMAELNAAESIAKSLGAIEHRILHIDLGALGGSALTDSDIEVPTSPTEGIPVTYVPARNTVFLSLSLAWAEVLGANDIFIGVNAVDYSGYPDCRLEYIKAYEAMANLATRAAVEGERITIHTPLINLSKAEIIKLGVASGVNYAVTVSCYISDDEGRACGECDSCRLRAKGFEEAGVDDPTRYQC
jgi:7-cyano-7-deazaguanine synthase